MKLRIKGDNLKALFVAGWFEGAPKEVHQNMDRTCSLILFCAFLVVSVLCLEGFIHLTWTLFLTKLEKDRHTVSLASSREAVLPDLWVL